MICFGCQAPIGDTDDPDRVGGEPVCTNYPNCLPGEGDR